MKRWQMRACRVTAKLRGNMVMIRAGICECATKLEAANWDKVVVTDQRSRGGDEIVELEEENSKSASGGFCLMGCCVQEVQRSVTMAFFFCS
jgi:hypothetical protein